MPISQEIAVLRTVLMEGPYRPLVVPEEAFYQIEGDEIPVVRSATLLMCQRLAMDKTPLTAACEILTSICFGTNGLPV